MPVPVSVEHRNRTFRNQRVLLDGVIFRKCTFIDCELVYSGGEPPSFLDECFFQGGRSSLEGPAGRTFQYLKDMLVEGSPLRASLLEDLPVLGTAIDNQDSFFKVDRR